MKRKKKCQNNQTVHRTTFYEQDRRHRNKTRLKERQIKQTRNGKNSPT